MGHGFRRLWRLASDSALLDGTTTIRESSVCTAWSCARRATRQLGRNDDHIPIGHAGSRHRSNCIRYSAKAHQQFLDSLGIGSHPAGIVRIPVAINRPGGVLAGSDAHYVRILGVYRW